MYNLYSADVGGKTPIDFSGAIFPGTSCSQGILWFYS